MDYFRVEIHGDRNVTFDGDELDQALVFFLEHMRSDQKTSLVYIGEEYDEE